MTTCLPAMSISGRKSRPAALTSSKQRALVARALCFFMPLWHAAKIRREEVAGFTGVIVMARRPKLTRDVTDETICLKADRLFNGDIVCALGLDAWFRAHLADGAHVPADRAAHLLPRCGRSSDAQGREVRGALRDDGRRAARVRLRLLLLAYNTCE